MNYTNIKQISTLNNFQIIGQWGVKQNNLKYNGTLVHNKDGIHLFLYKYGIKSGFNNINKMYGQGTLIIKDDDHYSNFLTKITLDGTSFINESTTFNTSITSHKFFEISVSFMYIGDCFIQDDTELYNTNVYLTNFNNWLTYPMPTFSGNENDSEKMWMYSFSNPNEFKVYKKNVNKNNCIRLEYNLKAIMPHNNINFDLNGKIFGFKILNSLSIKGKSLNINNVIKYSNDILSWYSLVTNKREMLFNIIINTQDDKTISVFNGESFKIPSKNKDISIQKDRDANFVDNILKSLKNYLNDSKHLNPIFDQGVNLNNYGTVDQQVHFACTMLQVIYDTFYKRRKKLTFRQKIKIIMKDADNSLISIAMKKMHINNYSDFIQEIVTIRNNTSHSYFDADKSNYVNIIFMLKTLHLIIREWLLSRIGISEKYIKNEKNINKLYHLEI